MTTRADFWSGTTARARRFKSPLREWVNSGLMTFFFFVPGLAGRREFACRAQSAPPARAKLAAS